MKAGIIVRHAKEVKGVQCANVRILVFFEAKTYGVCALRHQRRSRDKYCFLAMVFELFPFVSELVFGFDRTGTVPQINE